MPCLDSRRRQLARTPVKLWDRLNKFYLDKLDSEVSQDTYLERKAKFEAELDDVRSKIAAHQTADRKYLEYGVKLFELAQNAYSSYSRRSPAEKRRLLNFICSNCALDDGEVTPNYRKPFDLIASAASMTEKGNCPNPSDLSSHPLEYPLRDSFRTLLARITNL